ncbi:MAG: hypothetical protein Q9168_003881 [Polycauliona sp. 1 TL-2023]
MSTFDSMFHLKNFRGTAYSHAPLQKRMVLHLFRALPVIKSINAAENLKMHLPTHSAMITALSLLSLLANPVIARAICEEKATHCWNDSKPKNMQTLVPTQNMRDLATELQTIKSDDKTYMPARRTHTWFQGGARVCVANEYPFQTSHVSNFTVGAGAQKIIDKCCLDTDECDSGYTQLRGDNDLCLDLTLSRVSEECKSKSKMTLSLKFLSC